MSILRKIRDKNFERMLEEGVDLNLLLLLQRVDDNFDITTYKHDKVRGWISGLIRRGLITEEYKITLDGKNILSLLEEDLGRSTLKRVAVSKEGEFMKWWLVYPSTNNFVYNNKSFPGSQNKRVKQKECEVIFNKLINEEEFTAEDIINGTINHIEIAKKLSYSERENKLTYIANSLRYLTERMFSPYIKQAEKKEINKDFEI